jgi:Mg2+ and Co2+ transporter CorA
MAESDSIVAAIKSMADALLDRVNKTENDFVLHLQKVEDRLDQLVELTKNVAVIQAQASAQGEQMSELRAQFRSMENKFEGAVNRIHKRIDDLGESVHTQIDLQSKSFTIEMNPVKNNHNTLNTEVQKHLNRAIGAVGIISFVIMTFSWIGNNWIKALEDRLEKNSKYQDVTKMTIDTLDMRVMELERIRKRGPQ